MIMKLLLLITALGTILGCNSQSQKNIKREVYMGFKLGSGKQEANNLFQKLVADKKIKAFGRTPYIENYIPVNRYYFSSFSFNVPATDSLVNRLTIVYSDYLNENFTNVVRVSNSATGQHFYNELTNPNQLTDFDIANDVVKKVSLNYAAYDKADTATLEGTTFMSYHWRNRNGINIELTHDFRNQYDPLINDTRHYYYVQLTYTYTDEMEKKIFKKKSIY